MSFGSTQRGPTLVTSNKYMYMYLHVYMYLWLYSNKRLRELQACISCTVFCFTSPSLSSAISPFLQSTCRANCRHSEHTLISSHTTYLIHVKGGRERGREEGEREGGGCLGCEYVHYSSYMTLIGVHEMHGRMHPNQGHVTILFAVDLM